MSSAAEANARVGAAAVSRDYARPGLGRGVVQAVPEAEKVDRVGYASTCLGRPVWIRNDMRDAVPRRREDLSFPTFTFELASNPSADGVKGQERFAKGFDKLQRASERAAKSAAKRAAPKLKPAKVATVRVQAGRVLEVVGLPRGYSFTIEEVA